MIPTVSTLSPSGRSSLCATSSLPRGCCCSFFCRQKTLDCELGEEWEMTFVCAQPSTEPILHDSLVCSSYLLYLHAKINSRSIIKSLWTCWENLLNIKTSLRHIDIYTWHRLRYIEAERGRNCCWLAELRHTFTRILNLMKRHKTNCCWALSF